MQLPPARKKVSQPETQPDNGKPKHVRVALDVAELTAQIHKMLEMSTFEPETHYWLQTGNPELNAALGSRRLGIPFGKILEFSGIEHGGKTTVGLVLGGMAQRNGAVMGYVDLEASRDQAWAEQLGVDFASTLCLYPKLIYPEKRTKNTVPDLQSAEQLFKEAETAMHLLHNKGYRKQYWLIDSVANIQPQTALDAGLDGQTMYTKQARASFLSTLLPRWAALAANYNMMIVLVNQMRDRPGVMFGPKRTTPGGRALRHCAQVRAEIKRAPKGRLRQGSKTVGILGVIQNNKNKSGGGSVEGCKCGFKIRWDKEPAVIEFMPARQALSNKESEE